MSEELPAPDLARVAATKPGIEDLVTLTAGTRFVLIHPLAGTHPRQWNQMRSWGPTTSRFDHHLPPPHDQDRAITYVARGDQGFTTALAECFQDHSGKGVSPVDVSRGLPNQTVFDSAIDTVLLNLDSSWVTRAGGNAAICSGSRARAREWARAIYEAFGASGSDPLVHGLAYRSSIWPPGDCAALWESAGGIFPSSPLATRLLSDPGLEVALADALEELNTYKV